MILIRKVKAPFGWMSNMSAHPIEHEGKVFRTAEALFQCMRFADEEIIDKIRAERSPMSAKMVAKGNADKMVIVPCSEQDLKNMMLCLRFKIEQHPDLRAELIDTHEEIVEDCTNRQHGSGLFWGKGLKAGEWRGENWLGKLWMELREHLIVGDWVASWKTTESLPPVEL